MCMDLNDSIYPNYYMGKGTQMHFAVWLVALLSTTYSTKQLLGLLGNRLT